MKNIRKFILSKNNVLLFFYGSFIVFLPWQIRWIFFEQKMHGEIWEYGTLGLYASMIILALTALSFASDKELRPYFSKDKFLYASFAYFFVASIFSPMPQISFYYLLLVFLAILFAHIFKYIPRIFSLKMFLLSALIQGLCALRQFANQEIVANKWLGLAGHLPQNLGDSVVEFSGNRILRAYGSFPHPNILGGFLFVGILIGIYLWFRFYQDRQAERWQGKSSTLQLFYFLFIIVSLVTMTFAILASFSRSALLALLLSLAALLFFSILKSNWLLVNVIGKYLMFFTFIFIIFNMWVPGAWSSRIIGNDRLEIKSSEERIDSLGQFYWHDTKTVLLGQGLGMNSLVTYKNNIDRPIYGAQPIHNVFLLALAEVGIIGLLFLLGIFIRIWKVFKKANNFSKILFLGVLVIAMFDHYFWTTWSGWLLLVFAIVNLREQK